VEHAQHHQQIQREQGLAGQIAGAARSGAPEDDRTVVARGEDRAVAGRKSEALQLGHMPAQGLQAARQVSLLQQQRARGAAALGRCKMRVRGVGARSRGRTARDTQAHTRDIGRAQTTTARTTSRSSAKQGM